MMTCTDRIVFALLGFGLIATVADAQQHPEHGPDWPDWAYGELDSLSPDDRVAPLCPPTTQNPIDCSYIGDPVADDGIKRSLPGTDLTFTRNEAYFSFGPADWYPGEHPEMPPVVANGREADGIKACGLCHYPNGQGKMENGHVSGLPKQYFLDQLALFSSGDRRSADRRKANSSEMAIIAASLTEEEKQQVAEYYSSMPYRQMVTVIEATEAPQVYGTNNRLLLPIPDVPPMPLGQRIIEIPEHPERTGMSRDPRGGFVAYVPVGSLERGQELVSNGAGKTIQCGICHGPEMKGIGPIPSIAGRTTSYAMRQLWDIKQGTRVSPIMTPIVANLEVDDMIAIVAYLGSLPP